MTVAPPEPVDDVGWLYDVLGADHDAEPLPYLARPTLADVQLLLPTAPRRSAAASLRRLDADRSIRARLELRVGRAAGRLGLLGLAPGEPVTLPRFELVDHLARVLGETDLRAAVTLGPPRRNRKPVLQLLRPDGRIVGFAKVGWSPLTRDLVTTEADVLRAIDGRLPSTVIAPAVLAIEQWRGMVVVVTNELRGPRVRTARGRSLAETMTAIANAGPTAHRSVAASTTVADAVRLGADQVIDVDRLLERHGDVILRTGLWHGDLTPWNMSSRGRLLLVWDWELAGWDRPYGFDALHHLFERLRRRPGGSNAMALRAVVERGAVVLADLGVRLDHRRSEAMLDLYLCELIGRELRLDGQRWSGGTLATLADDAAMMLRRRLD